MEPLGDEGEQNEAGVHRIEAALDGWLAAPPAHQPEWADIDAINVDATVRFTDHLLRESAGLLPADLMHRLFIADAMAPMLTARSRFVTRLFEADLRPLAPDRVAPLTGRDRRAIELDRVELLLLFEQLRAYSGHMRGIQLELTRLGF